MISACKSKVRPNLGHVKIVTVSQNYASNCLNNANSLDNVSSLAVIDAFGTDFNLNAFMKANLVAHSHTGMKYAKCGKVSCTRHSGVMFKLRTKSMCATSTSSQHKMHGRRNQH